MPDLWTIEFEGPGGDTESSTQPWLPLYWRSATVTLRRRAPHVLSVVVVRRASGEPGSYIVDFKAGREIRFLRNGTYWLTGFMDAPSLSGYSAERRRFSSITLPGWGNAYALMLSRNTHRTDGPGVNYGGFDVDGIVSNILDNVEHGAGGDWFNAAGRTIWASATSLQPITLTGKSALEQINDVCDIDGATWRAGVNGNTGTFMFKAGPTGVTVDLTGSIHLYDALNCSIVDFRQDGTNVTTTVWVASKRPVLDTRVAVASLAAATTLQLDSVGGLGDGGNASEGDNLSIGVGLATEETRYVTSISGTTVTLSSGMTNAHAANEVVKITQPGQFRRSVRTAAATVAQAHHTRHFWLYNDTLNDLKRREETGDQFLTAYDHVLATATIEVTDAVMIDAILDARLEPGDTVLASSLDADLANFYWYTTVTVQEMTLALEPGGVRQITLTIGDPRQDEYMRFERRLASMQAATTAAAGA